MLKQNFYFILPYFFILTLLVLLFFEDKTITRIMIALGQIFIIILCICTIVFDLLRTKLMPFYLIELRNMAMVSIGNQIVYAYSSKNENQNKNKDQQTTEVKNVFEFLSDLLNNMQHQFNNQHSSNSLHTSSTLSSSNNQQNKIPTQKDGQRPSSMGRGFFEISKDNNSKKNNLTNSEGIQLSLATEDLSKNNSKFLNVTSEKNDIITKELDDILDSVLTESEQDTSTKK